MNRYIKLDENNRIISIRYGSEIVEGEIESDMGELGQIMQPDGTFVNPEPEPEPEPEPGPTLEDIERKQVELERTVAILFEMMLGGE